MPTLLCLSSGIRPRYLQDVLRVISKPNGSQLRFRYSENPIPTDLRDIVLTQKPGGCHPTNAGPAKALTSEASCPTPAFSSIDELRARLAAIRRVLEPAFGPDTALGGVRGNAASTGHCAAVAAVVQKALGGSLVSAIVRGQSHWFNRFDVGADQIDADITGDQFGFPVVQIAPKGALFQGTRSRSSLEINKETLHRSRVLAQRSGQPTPELNPN